MLLMHQTHNLFLFSLSKPFVVPKIFIDILPSLLSPLLEIQRAPLNYLLNQIQVDSVDQLINHLR